jgi:hypothetical protein
MIETIPLIVIESLDDGCCEPDCCPDCGDCC